MTPPAYKEFTKDRFKVTRERLSAASKVVGLPNLGLLWSGISVPVNGLLHNGAVSY